MHRCLSVLSTDKQAIKKPGFPGFFIACFFLRLGIHGGA
jgi:hypothetical protein